MFDGHSDHVQYDTECDEQLEDKVRDNRMQAVLYRQPANETVAYRRAARAVTIYEVVVAEVYERETEVEEVEMEVEVGEITIEWQ